ncbi:mycofactocin radical SAM maturase [Janibacter terrae]|uniref:Mycofactocin radical SAM maturase n=1 Tax=Janibacter terrae TaxID=103817 RepID=A0ABZ2FIQ9_9MICO
MKLVEHFERGLDAPVCLTWELTYACNLECAHCLSSSGRRDPRELTTEQCEAVIDELQAMQVFYVNIGGGEPTVRPDFWHLVEYAVAHDVGVKFSTNGVRLTPDRARWLAGTDYVDVQISLDGATPEVNDRVRGEGSYAMAIQALENLAAGFRCQDQRRLHPRKCRPARRPQGARRPLRRHPATDQATPERAWR